MDEGMSGLILLAIPLFVLLGQLVEVTGMARVMVAFLASLLGHVKAGMSYVLLGAMLLVSGISGSKTADMAAVAPVLFPEMRKRGMKDGELLSLLAASGAMSETIPPSIVLIAIASVTGVSIAALFTAGSCRRWFWHWCWPASRATGRGARKNQVVVARAPAAVVMKTLLVALPALLLPFLIRTAVVEGFAHRDRGVHHRHRLFAAARPGDLPRRLELAGRAAHAGAHRLALRRHPVHRRCGERHAWR